MKQAGRGARGDTHYSRTRPEKLARGAKHGSRLHPEKFWGEGNNKAKLTDPQRAALIEEFVSASAPIRFLARKHSITPQSVRMILRRAGVKH